jgi:predicted GH43/DUF377 family glycosyl hydrolase
VFNPAAIVKDGLVQLLYRAQGPDGRSSIGLAKSSDGVRFKRLSEPVMVATERKHGPLFPDFETRTVGKPWSKSGRS